MVLAYPLSRTSSDRAMLDYVRKALRLSDSELGDLFGVKRQAVQQWRARGVPPTRVADLDRAAELTQHLQRRIIPERLPQVVRTVAAGLEGRSMLQVIAAEGVLPIYAYLERLFSYIPA